MDGVVVDEIAEVVEHGIVDTVEHVGGVTGDGVAPARRRSAAATGTWRDRREEPCSGPSERCDHHVGAQLGDAVNQPVRDAVAQVCMPDPGLSRPAAKSSG